MHHLLILFPHQLFNIDIISQSTTSHIILLEDPAFFGDRAGSAHGPLGPKALKLNRMRILYMRVCMRLYVHYLQQQANLRVTHIKVDQLWKTRYAPLKAHGTEFKAFHVTDKLVEQRLKKAGIKVTWLESPSFIMTTDDLANYMRGREQKRMQHAHFFEHVKRKLNILVGVPSTDTQNRAPFPKTGTAATDIPDPYTHTLDDQQLRTQLWNEEVAWLLASRFAANSGPIDDPKLPMTHRDVKRWLDKFIRERLPNFGKYQDAMVPDKHYMFHSGLSIYLNTGLITPIEVVNAITKTRATLQNREAFLRQLMGWREYARCYYLYVPPSVYRKNIFNNTRTLDKSWYTTAQPKPSTNSISLITVITDAIKDAWSHGYLHHIRRLMVLSNYMTLAGIHPDQVYKWMYEFSLDSWDWVMVFNVYSMGTWSDGGVAMRKPYISSAAYLQRMARMNKKQDIQEWNRLFIAFIKRNHAILKHTQLAGIARRLVP